MEWCEDKEKVDYGPNKMKSEKTKKRKHRKKILKALLVFVALLLVVLVVVLYNPVRTMASLEKVDDFPLYVMRYHGGYFFDLFSEHGIEWGPYKKIDKMMNPDACTSFAAQNPQTENVFGRNFDWEHRSSLLLFTDPPNGYASVSMVDLYYLGLEGKQQIPWSERINLLASPYATIDGMNECGVAIAQNAVPRCKIAKDPNRPTLVNTQIVRLVLDHAKDVNEAVELIRKYNIEFPSVYVHFHIADTSGHSAIVEYIDDGISIVRDDNPWQVSTNFLISEETKPRCFRYDTANERLAESLGAISQDDAMNLLKAVKLDNTVWSIVYNLDSGKILLSVGQDYQNLHRFELQMKR